MGSEKHDDTCPCGGLWVGGRCGRCGAACDCAKCTKVREQAFELFAHIAGAVKRRKLGGSDGE